MMEFQKQRMGDLLKQADDMQTMIDVTENQYEIMKKMVGLTLKMSDQTHELSEVLDELRDNFADFDDFWRPIRNYLYWEPHCYNIPLCWAVRGIFDTLDGVDKISEKLHKLLRDLDQMNEVLPQVLALLPQMIETMKSMRIMQLTMHSTMSGTFAAADTNSENVTALGQAFDAAQNDDTFFLPPEVFENEDFKRAMGSFLSPDGKAAVSYTHLTLPTNREV